MPGVSEEGELGRVQSRPRWLPQAKLCFSATIAPGLSARPGLQLSAHPSLQVLIYSPNVEYHLSGGDSRCYCSPDLPTASGQQPRRWSFPGLPCEERGLLMLLPSRLAQAMLPPPGPPSRVLSHVPQAFPAVPCRFRQRWKPPTQFGIHCMIFWILKISREGRLIGSVG